MSPVFLSRLRLNSVNLQVIRDGGDVGQLHRTVMGAFPDSDASRPREAFGVLFRAEVVNERRTLIVQSTTEPDWGALPSGYAGSVETKMIEPALSSIESGRRYQFLLVANPSKKARRNDHNSRRVELATEESRYCWLRTHLEREGCRLFAEAASGGVSIDPVLLPAYTLKGEDATGITVKPVRYQGVLEVIDADLVRAAVVKGIGPAKAYGCGLLSLAPVR